MGVPKHATAAGQTMGIHSQLDSASSATTPKASCKVTAGGNICISASEQCSKAYKEHQIMHLGLHVRRNTGTKPGGAPDKSAGDPLAKPGGIEKSKHAATAG